MHYKRTYGYCERPQRKVLQFAHILRRGIEKFHPSSVFPQPMSRWISVHTTSVIVSKALTVEWEDKKSFNLRYRPIFSGSKTDLTPTVSHEILGACPDCRFDKATQYEEAVQKINTSAYDLVILAVMGVRGFDLLELAVNRNLRVVMLTAHAFSPEALKRSYELKARSYLPKDKLGEVVPFLEDALTHEFSSGWNRLFEKMNDFFDQRFGKEWKSKLGTDWWGWD